VVRDSIGATQTRRKPPGNLDQEFITCAISKTVVEHLEVIDIDQEDGELKIWVPSRNVDGALQAI
jgi:hypothetical protein